MTSDTTVFFIGPRDALYVHFSSPDQKSAWLKDIKGVLPSGGMFVFCCCRHSVAVVCRCHYRHGCCHGSVAAVVVGIGRDVVAKTTKTINAEILFVAFFAVLPPSMYTRAG